VDACGDEWCDYPPPPLHSRPPIEERRNPPRSPAGEAPAGEATQGSNFALKRQNATCQLSTPLVILQSSLCIWRR
jgi:hypothetical protein